MTKKQTPKTAPKDKALSSAVVGQLVMADQVTRPDGSTVTISGNLYVFDVPGEHVVDGQTVLVEER